MSERRLVAYRDNRYAAQLVTEHDGAVRWYVWDVRGSDPWWLPEATVEDHPGRDARSVIDEYLMLPRAEDV